MLVTRSSLIEVETLVVGRVGDGGVVAPGTFLGEDAAIFLHHAARLAGESAGAFGIGALQGNQDGVFGGAEVVVLGEHTGACGGSDAIFGTAIVEVVPQMHAHCADTGMARVAMVKPVVMIGDVVGPGLTLHAAHARLARVPEVAVVYGDKFRI